MRSVQGEQHLERYRVLAWALDSRFRLPGTSIRFGWDAVVGLIPGIGDAAGSLLGAYGLYVGYRLGAGRAVMLRMLLNLVVDTVVGVVPVAGDLVDVAWRANLRNVALLDRWLASPDRVGRRSALLLLALVATVVGAAAAVLWCVWWVGQALLHRGG
jgi:Domain of unknown function (DUF4112)